MQRNFFGKMIRASSNVAKSFLGLGGGLGGLLSVDAFSPSTYRGTGSAFGNNGWFFDVGGPGMDVYFSYSGLSDVVSAYEQCPPVYSIVNKQAYAFVNGKTWITKNGKESFNPYATKMKALFMNPNALQNGKQFEAQIAIYLRLFKFCVILPIKPFGFPNEEASALWIIPPYMCEFTYAKQTFYNLKKGFITSLKITYGSEISYLDAENVIILRDISPSFTTLFIPESPIKPIAKNISNLIAIYNSKGMLINNRGALGILSPEKDPAGSIPMEKTEKEEMQQGLMRYGIKSGQWKFIVTNSAMKWQQIGISARELMLTEWAEDDTMIVCDALNYPYRLLANTATSSMAGQEVEAFKKILYQDFVLPFSEMIYEQLSEAFNAGNYGCKIEKDYSFITVLQEDDLKKAQARQTRNNALLVEYQHDLITRNRWLELNGEDTVTGGDILYSQWIKENPEMLQARQLGNAQSASSNSNSSTIQPAA